MAAVNLGDLLVTTARAFSKTVADNVTNNNALLKYLNKRGNIKEKLGGGRVIDEYLMYNTNGSVSPYTDYDTFTPPTTGQEVIDAAEYAWKQTGGFVAISGREEAMNAGEFQRKDLLTARLDQLDANIQNSIAAQLFSNGTGSGGKEIGGLQLLVADAPSGAGTVGGINQATNPFWRNYASGTVTVASGDIQGRMNTAWLSTFRGTDQIDLILADSTLYSTYWASLQAIQRITTAEEGKAGFATLKYQAADVVYDYNCPSKHMYFLNTKYLACKYAPGKWFTTGDKRTIANADYVVVPMWVMCNLTTGRRAAHGVLVDD